ncbi:nuclear transport factor 2 family protein [Sphingobium mellinum]|uniref:nuclear transport factor 2 family protein n=1 Tax=Sphingobium mellinum TaxID=1387166 RepID=UPI0030EDD31D
MANASYPFAGTSFGPRGARPASIEERVQLIEDHEDIARLMSLYCQYNDGGWEGQGPSHMGPSADLFVEDGVWDDCGPIGRAEGREKIRALFNVLRASPYVSHNVMNPLIDVNGDTAKGHWHLIALSKRPNGRAVEDNDGRWTLAIYNVEFQRTSDGWRFTRMEVRRGREMPQRGYNPPPQWSVD